MRGALFTIRALAVAAVAMVPASAESPPPGLAAKLKQVVSRDGAPGVTALVLKNGHLLYRLDEGAIARDAQLPVASASKWMTASLVMTVVDEGKLSLDEPIGKRLPQFTGRAGQITLRQLLSFTAGQGGLSPEMFDLRQGPHITLAEAAAQITTRPLADEPGTTFRYGGPSMQVAGALVEQATGKSWAALFHERIAGPLGLAHTYWGNPLLAQLKLEEVRNPNLQGGVYRGKRILSAGAIDQMETWQTRDRRMAYLPPRGGESGPIRSGQLVCRGGERQRPLLAGFQPRGIRDGPVDRPAHRALRRLLPQISSAESSRGPARGARHDHRRGQGQNPLEAVREVDA